MIYEFIWNGKTDKVKRNLFEQEFKNGGYKMINFNCIITADNNTMAESSMALR